MKKIEALIEDVIDKAKAVQAEQGPDRDYRRWAEEALKKAKTKLLQAIKKQSRREGKDE